MSEQKTIFEGLYQIDWAKIRHLEGQSSLYEIPNALWDLLSGVLDIRHDAYNLLFGANTEEYGEILETTLFILPFLLEVLELEEADDKGKILQYLAIMLKRNKFTFKTVKSMKDYIAVYNAIENHIENLIKLAFQQKNDLETRIDSIRVLGQLSDNTDDIFPVLCNIFEQDKDQEIQIEILMAIESLFEVRTFFLSRKTCVSFFHHILDAHTSLRVQYFAARAGIIAAPMNLWHRHIPSNEISPLTYTTLFKIFWQEYFQGNYENKKILSYFLKLSDAQGYLLDMFSDDRLFGDDIALVAKALLFNAFRLIHIDKNHFLQSPIQMSGGKMYHLGFTFSHPQILAVKHLSEKQIIALTAILNCDKFWQTRTNLLSFFLGLPDSRDELRAFLENDKD